MFDALAKLYQIDWRIFLAGASAWLEGRNPYAALSPEFSAGAFAYPPTALPWLAVFVPLGAYGFFVWTALELLLWWAIARREHRSHLLLFLWSPIILHFVEGQSTLMVVLALWAAYRAEQRGWLWGFVLAWAMTKPQVAIVPLAWLLWQDRASPTRWRMWSGIALGTAVLALIPTLVNPSIWGDWLASLPAYRARILQMGAWQGASIVLFALAAYLWYRSRLSGWQWWLAAAAFPQTSFYALVALLPALRPRLNNWTLAGLALAGTLQGPMRVLLNDGRVLILLPWILCGHLLAAWLLAQSTRRPIGKRGTIAPSHDQTLSSHAAPDSDLRPS